MEFCSCTSQVSVLFPTDLQSYSSTVILLVCYTYTIITELHNLYTQIIQKPANIGLITPQVDSNYLKLRAGFTLNLQHST